ncbi:MAG: hypothetical protein K8R54_09515 [Bacteroidales bacterium]|nr:hypothetical protein [Bacteroidales bacterium]
MKHKTLSTQSARFINELNVNEKLCFTSKDAYEILKDANEENVRKLLSNLVSRGLLMRLKKGLYYIIPYEKDPQTFIPEWHLIVKYFVDNAKYYIAYYSALEIHGLITQPALTEQIVVSKQIKPSKSKIKNIEFQFIYHNEKHFFGYKKIWINDYDKVLCSDLEKTIVDCLYKPDYAGGIVEISKALYKARKQLDYTRLFEYTKKFDSQSVIKRLGFLLELFEIETKIIKKLQSVKMSSYALLDTTLPKTGNRISKWNLQINCDLETVKNSIYT